MANKTTKFSNIQEAAIAIVASDYNTEKRSQDPNWVDITPDEFWNMIALSVADNYVAQVDEREIKDIVAKIKAASKPKREAAKAALN